MIAGLREWHSRYVCEVWKPGIHEDDTATAVASEVSLPGLCECELFAPPPVLEVYRRAVERAWGKLNLAVSEELARASRLSVHYEWIEEVAELLDGGTYPGWVYEERAGKLRRLLRAYPLYYQEDKAVRGIASWLAAVGRELKGLQQAEKAELKKLKST